MPVDERGGFIREETEVGSEIYFLECGGEVEIDWRTINRIAAQDYDEIHFAGVHIADEFRERLALVHRIPVARFRVCYGFTDVAERLIHGMRKGMHVGRLIRTGDYDAGSVMS